MMAGWRQVVSDWVTASCVRRPFDNGWLAAAAPGHAGGSSGARALGPAGGPRLRRRPAAPGSRDPRGCVGSLSEAKISISPVSDPNLTTLEVVFV